MREATEVADTAAHGSEWHWNGQQWLWWNGTEWLEAGVGPSPGAADPAADAATANPSEPVLSVIPVVALQAGFMGFDSTTFSLVFTNQRIVFARHNDALIAQFSQQEQQRAAAQDRSRLSQFAASLNAWDRLAEWFRQRGPDAILADHPGNFALDRDHVTSVKLKSTGNGSAQAPRMDYLILRTQEKKYKMNLAGGDEDARAALQTAGLMSD